MKVPYDEGLANHVGKKEEKRATGKKCNTRTASWSARYHCIKFSHRSLKFNPRCIKITQRSLKFRQRSLKFNQRSLKFNQLLLCGL